MVADDLVLVRRLLGQPVGDALVQVGAHLLGQALVGGLADQPVGEAERVLAAGPGAVGVDELLLHQRQQPPLQLRPLALREQLGERGQVEAASLDRGAPKDRSLPGLEAVDAGREHGLQGRRQRPLPLLGLSGDELLEEQRIAFRGVDDPARDARLERGRGDRADERARLCVREAVDHDL